MKKIHFKSMALGFAIAIVVFSTILSANAAATIKSAQFAETKVYFYGKEVELKNPLVSIVADGESNARLYMPLRELLEFMNFVVDWDGENNSVNLTMRWSIDNGGNVSDLSHNNNFNGQNAASDQWFVKDYTQAEANERALTVINLSGTWGPEIDWLIPQMSPEAVFEMVSIYLDKQLFPGTTTPTQAKTVEERIKIALEHMNEADRKTISDRIMKFY